MMSPLKERVGSIDRDTSLNGIKHLKKGLIGQPHLKKGNH